MDLRGGLLLSPEVGGENRDQTLKFSGPRIYPEISGDPLKDSEQLLWSGLPLKRILLLLLESGL